MERRIPVFIVSFVALGAILFQACSPKAQLSFDYRAATANLDANSITVRAFVDEVGFVEDFGGLHAKVEVSHVDDPDAYEPVPVSGMSRDSNNPNAIILLVENLAPVQVYRLRFQLFKDGNNGAEIEVSKKSPWYWAMTSGSSEVDQARAGIVTLALTEWATYGEFGRKKKNGTRYGADPEELWCSEYYSWVSGHYLTEMDGRSSARSLTRYFSNHEALYPGPSIPEVAQPGDYLAMWGTKHSGMFLGFIQAKGKPYIHTIEGNTGSKIRFRKRSFDPESFRLGHLVEAQVKR
jgi:hypothetical protein